MDFEWYEDYSVGVDEIDVQHKRMVGLMRRTYELKDSPRDASHVEHLLNDLIKYTALHLDCEELFMVTYNYPHYAKQKSEHDRLRSELRERVDRVGRGEEQLTGLVFFLMQWFVNHCNHFDKDLGAYLLKNSALG